jgi:hypothetical protein
MDIEFYSKLNESMTPKIITVEIDENLPIKELLSKLHDITGIERYIEIHWDNRVEKVAYDYFYKQTSEEIPFHWIDDLDRKISDFPKNGTNGELCILMSAGTVN